MSDGRYDHRKQGIIHPHLRDQAQKTHCRNLSRHYKDRHDECKGHLLQLKIISIKPICGQCGKVSTDCRRAAGNDQTVENPPHHGKGSVIGHTFQISEEILSRQCRKPFHQVCMGTRCVYKQDIEEKETQK